MQKIAQSEHPSTDQTTTDQLISLTSQLAFNEARAVEATLAASLRKHVLACFVENRNAALEAALEHLSTKVVDSPFFTLQSNIETVIQRLELSPEKSSTLFVIPVITTLPYSNENKMGTLDPTKELLNIAQAFKKTGLVSEKGNVGLIPYLYHAAELQAMSYAETYEMHQAIVESATHKRPVTTSSLGRDGWPPSSTEGDYQLGLRYFVGFVVDSTENFVLYDDRSPSSAQEYSNKMADFLDMVHDDIDTLVSQHSPQCECLIGQPQLYFEGRRKGMTEVSDLALQSALTESLMHCGVSPRGVRIVLSPYFFEGDSDFQGVEITGVSVLTQDILFSHVRYVHTFEDASVLVEDMKEQYVSEFGFSEVNFLEFSPEKVDVIALAVEEAQGTVLH